VRDVRLALGGVAHKPWRAWAKAEAALRDGRRTADSFRAAAEAELADAVGLRDNAFKIELAKRTIVAVLEELKPDEPKSMSGDLKPRSASPPGRWQPGITPDPLLRKHGALGQPVSRVDGPLKVRARHAFAAEFSYETMLRGARLQPHRARPYNRLERRRGRSRAGVRLVMTYRNAPRMKAPSLMMSSPTAAGQRPAGDAGRRDPLERPADRTRTGRNAGAGRLRGLADRGDLCLEPGHHLVRRGEADAAAARNACSASLRARDRRCRGRAAGAEVKVDVVYRTPRHNHNAIELHAATAELDRRRAAPSTMPARCWI
jgi:hypothetical protein